MMILIRFILVSLIVYLIIRSFMRLGQSEEPTIRRSEPEKSSKGADKKISKEIGEYIDYEEVKKQNR
jgi:hypothetical protein